MGTLNIGLVGASRVATYAIIAPARATAGLCVHGVAARDPGRARHYAVEHGLARAYPEYADLVNDPAIDLVYLGTPPASHVDQALAAITAGKPVLVEKPFALDAAGARLVYEAAQASGVPVFEAMHSPHHALFRRLTALLREGAIGKLRHTEAVFDAPIASDDPIRWSGTLGGGALMDLGVYPLAWLRRIAGETFTVELATAEMRGDVDASFSASLRFADGMTATVESSMTATDRAARLVIEGERGRISVMNPLAPQLGHALMITLDGTTQTETVDGPSSYQAQLTAVRETLVNGKEFPFPSDDYVHSMTAIDQVRAAWPVAVGPRPT